MPMLPGSAASCPGSVGSRDDGIGSGPAPARVLDGGEAAVVTPPLAEECGQPAEGAQIWVEAFVRVDLLGHIHGSHVVGKQDRDLLALAVNVALGRAQRRRIRLRLVEASTA
jgi:hypothetical protein